LNFTRKFYFITVVALFFAGLATLLGFWQLSRAAQKQGLQAKIEAQASQPPLNTQDLQAMPSGLTGLYRPVRLAGIWESQHTVYLDNRQMNDKVGFFVLTPLRLQDTGQFVVVQRGWVGRNFEVRTEIPKVDTPPGVVWVEGTIAPAPSKLFELGAAAIGPIRQNLDLTQFRKETGLQLADHTIRQTGVSHDGLLREWPPVALGVEKHYGYAFQWFALAVLIIGLYFWFQIFRRVPARFQEKPHDVPPPRL